MTLSVGVIGLGVMGYRMAGHLARGDHATVAVDKPTDERLFRSADRAGNGV